MERVAVDPEALADVRASSVPGATACRHCGAPLSLTVVDLGKSPLCQTVLTDEQLEQAEAFYPLHVRACEQCWLVQIPQFVPPEDIFTEYAYFSAYSDSWVEHARRYVDAMTERLALGPDSLVVEVASNDGYLLQHFLPKGVPVLGIEPALNVADAAVALGVETVTEFFGADLGRKLAEERRKADLVLGNNVLAQVPDINDFVEGVAALLAPGGTATFEFPHLAKLVEHLSTTRSITSTSRTSRSIRSARSSGPRVSTSSTWRSSRATEGRFGSSSATRVRASSRARPSPSSSTARTSRGCATRRRTAGSRRACASRSGRSSSS